MSLTARTSPSGMAAGFRKRVLENRARLRVVLPLAPAILGQHGGLLTDEEQIQRARESFRVVEREV